MPIQFQRRYNIVHMTRIQKDLLLCSVLTAILLALFMQGTSLAAGLNYGREKLKGTTSSQGDYSTPRPNIADAQNLTTQAHDKVIAAQGSGEWDGAGHAKKAEALLAQAANELKLAAEAPGRQ